MAEKLTNEEAFQKMADHLLTQGERSFTITKKGAEDCVYRSKDGLMCAIGCLIPDEWYNKDLEGCGVGDDEVIPIMDHVIEDPNQLMLEDLQCLHDNQKVEDWPSRLINLAKQFGFDNYKQIEV